MKGIVLAGGNGSRLYPLTLAVSKQLMPVYDKPMIYYPISTLMSCGIRDILIISTPEDRPLFEKMLKDGSDLGCCFSYAVQSEPNGIGEAFIVGASFIGKDSVALILGDNIFYGTGLSKILKYNTSPKGGIIFAYHVKDPQRYGVVEFDDKKNVISLEEKPKLPKSNYAIPGIYFYDNKVLDYVKKIQPSPRGELEITDINNLYLISGELKVQELDHGTAWLDTGTSTSLIQASQFVQVIEERQGLIIGSIEQEAYRQGFISQRQFINLIEPFIKTSYGAKLKLLLK